MPYYNRMKGKKHIIILTDAKKVFDKYNIFYDKNTQQTGSNRKYNKNYI